MWRGEGFAMTEAEWLDSNEPRHMLHFLKGRTSERKLRLFSCACCWHIEHLIRNQCALRVLESSERFADHNMSRDDFREDWARCFEGVFDTPSPDAAVAWAGHDPIHVRDVLMALEEIARGLVLDQRTDVRVELRTQATMMRDIFGYVVHHAVIDTCWKTDTVLTMARHSYSDRAFDRLPILADALEEAGCSDDAILEHCRGPGPHVRGCWVVDLLLGKE
jgi:hypothetical protein